MQRRLLMTTPIRGRDEEPTVAREFGGALDRRADHGLQVGAHFVADDAGEGGLAESGEAREENMIERLPALARRLDGNLQIADGPALSDELLERARTKTILKSGIVLDPGIFPSRHDLILAWPRWRG